MSNAEQKPNKNNNNNNFDNNNGHDNNKSATNPLDFSFRSLATVGVGGGMSVVSGRSQRSSKQNYDRYNISGTMGRLRSSLTGVSNTIIETEISIANAAAIAASAQQQQTHERSPLLSPLEKRKICKTNKTAKVLGMQMMIII